MPRLPRKVIPNRPHHVTQRGNRRQTTFFCDSDYVLYLSLLKKNCNEFNVNILAYCLMPNHVHLILIPPNENSLSIAVGRTHEYYTRAVNLREGWRGHLWQGRFFSVAMSDQYLEACLRYVELNPVRAKLCSEPEDYTWSSCRARINGTSDICSTLPLDISDWSAFLRKDDRIDVLDSIRKSSRSGKPLGIN